MSDNDALANWPPRVDDSEEPPERVREMVAHVDPTQEFPLHDHFLSTVEPDGSITVSLPWTTFTKTTFGDEMEACNAFWQDYKDLLIASREERDALTEGMISRGYVPLHQRADRNARD